MVEELSNSGLMRLEAEGVNLFAKNGVNKARIKHIGKELPQVKHD